MNVTQFFDISRRIYSAERIDNEVDDVILFYKYQDPYPHYEDTPFVSIFKAYKETPKGYWIVNEYDHHGTYVNPASKRWIRKQNPNDTHRRKLFAYQDKDEALYSYYRKKLEHLRHLETKHTQLKRIVRNLERSANFFGHQRPMITNITDFIHRTDSKLKPLNQERPKKAFIEELEMII